MVMLMIIILKSQVVSQTSHPLISVCIISCIVSSLSWVPIQYNSNPSGTNSFKIIYQLAIDTSHVTASHTYIAIQLATITLQHGCTCMIQNREVHQSYSVWAKAIITYSVILINSTIRQLALQLFFFGTRNAHILQPNLQLATSWCCAG